MSQTQELSRRYLLKVVGGFGATFVLGGFATAACASTEATEHKSKVVFEPNAYIKIDPDGTVTVVIAKSDMGQGVRTSLAMLVAEDLDVDWQKVKVEQAPVDSQKFGRQGTGGSSSISGSHDQMRRMGASARWMLVSAAAKQWGVPAEECRTEMGKVIHKASGKSLAYGELTTQAATETVPTSITLKDPSEFKILGKGTSKLDNRDIVTGKAVYGLDAKIDGMAYVVIARPPRFGATVSSVDDSAAKQIPGVIDVHKMDKGIAVIAKNTWAAISGRDALKIEWTPGPNREVSSKTIFASLNGALTDHKPLPTTDKVVEAHYEMPFLAHATMEPMNAVADVRADRCILWAPTQVPDGALRVITQITQLPATSVEVHTTLLGGGFGRRLQTDFIAEAVQLSKDLKMPIQLIWSREDDMKNDFYRPACIHSFKGTLDTSGKPTGWSHQAIQAGWGGNAEFGKAGIPYRIPEASMRFGGVNTPIPVGPWRSVEHTLLNVASETFINEMAVAAGKDPFAFRQDLITNPRLKAVLELAAEKSGWGTPLPSGHGRGIACFSGYGTCVAHVVELEVAGSKIKLNRVVAVVDCGFAVNPKGVEAQIQGACVDGLSTALRAAITIENGAVLQNSWTDYRWMTMDAMPKLEVHMISGSKEMGGMGEPGYPSVPAAVANAVAAATGKKVRRFPIVISELV